MVQGCTVLTALMLETPSLAIHKMSDWLNQRQVGAFIKHDQLQMMPFVHTYVDTILKSPAVLNVATLRRKRAQH